MTPLKHKQPVLSTKSTNIEPNQIRNYFQTRVRYLICRSHLLYRTWLKIVEASVSVDADRSPARLGLIIRTPAKIGSPGTRPKGGKRSASLLFPGLIALQTCRQLLRSPRASLVNWCIRSLQRLVLIRTSIKVEIQTYLINY